MKRNSLTTAVVAGIAGTVGIANLASAVTLNPDGLGQVLIYPYYTVNVPQNLADEPSNLTTAFSVVNTTNQGKAVKVRFLEGRNSREVRDFNLYLSPYDVWTATVFKLPGEDQANLLTDDESCTVPKIKTAADGASGGAIGTLPDGRKFVRFSSALYSADPIYGAAGSVGRSLANTREGHFEMIEMGVVGNNPGNNGGVARNSIAAITHTPAGIPANCQKVNDAWNAFPTAGYWTLDASVDLNPASGGLFGSASIVDGANGTMLPYSPDAVDGFFAQGGFFHSDPGNTLPSLASVGLPAATATALVFKNGQVVTATYGATAGTRRIDAFSAVFMYENILNEYVLGGAAAASTDWAVTFPTKGFYVDRPYRLGATGVALPPFVELYAPGGSCVEVQLTPFDREERGPGACTGSDADNPACDLCFSPCENPEESIPVLCYETQIISFQDAGDYATDATSPVLGSALAANIDTRADDLSEGWLRIGLNPVGETHALPTSAEGVTFFGLPVTGFSATNFVNDNAAPGKLANYSGLWKHKGSRNCTGPTPGGGVIGCS